jgi:hypothetical protein
MFLPGSTDQGGLHSACGLGWRALFSHWHKQEFVCGTAALPHLWIAGAVALVASAGRTGPRGGAPGFHLASHVVHQRRVGGEYLVGRKRRVSHLTQVPIAPASPEILATQPRFHRLRALPVAGGAPGGRRQRRRGSERRQGHPQQAAPRMSGTPLRRRAARRERSAAAPPQTDSRRPPRPHRTPASGRSGTGRPSVRACRLRRHQRMAPCRVASCNRPNAAIRSSLAVANIGL